MATQTEYYEATHKLLPQGTIWPESQETNSVLNDLIDVVAEAVKDVSDEAETQVDDSFPDSASPGNFIEDWERVLQLPKSWKGVSFFVADTGKCGEPLSTVGTNIFFPTTLAARRDAIISFLNTSRLNNEQFYLDMAIELGFTATVSTLSPLTWEIDVTAGDLAQIDTLISLANFFKPFHTELIVTY